MSVTTAEASFVASAALAAVTVTSCVAEIVAGALYSPVVLIDPTPAGAIDHVTAVFVVPLTVAANCAVPPAPKFAVLGDTAMLTEA